MRKINEIIVHCSATPEGRPVTVRTIRSWHKKRGWSDIGYHWVVYADGTVHAGRPEAKTGAHVRGHNRGTIGICYIGGMDRGMKNPKDTRTQAQKDALVQLILELKMRYPSITKVSGHNQYAAKACPSFDAGKEYRDIFQGPPDVPKAQSPTLVKLAATDRVSTTEIAAYLGILSTVTASLREVFENLSGMSIPMWFIWMLIPVILGSLVWIWKERRKYKQSAVKELGDA
jgi:N-acetylmuramoyl-L-alanine amidase